MGLWEWDNKTANKDKDLVTIFFFFPSFPSFSSPYWTVGDRIYSNIDSLIRVTYGEHFSY